MKKALTGEGMKLVKATAKQPSTLLCSDAGKGITTLKLAGGESIYVSGENVLAFENSVKWDITVAKLSSAVGNWKLFHVKLSGPGDVAVIAKYPVRMEVTPNCPVYTDPKNTIFWSNGLNLSIKTDIDLASLVGNKHGEEYQMKFEGSGYVVIGG